MAPRGLVPQTLGPDDIWGADEADREWCRAEIGKLRSEGIFTPPSVRGSLIVPGNIGGMAWGGAAYDRGHDLLIIPTNRLVAEVRLIPRADFEKERLRQKAHDARVLAGHLVWMRDDRLPSEERR